MSRAILVALLLILPTPGLSRPLYKLPTGTRLETPQGTFQGYTLEEMKVLLKMDVDLEFYEMEIPTYKQMVYDYQKIISSKDSMLASKDSQTKLLNDNSVRLTEKWSKENKLRHECENQPRWGSWLAWSVAAVTLTSAVVFGTVLAVHKD